MMIVSSQGEDPPLMEGGDAPDLVIHDFSCTGSIPSSTGGLLDDARRLISNSDWVKVGTPAPPIRSASRSFQYPPFTISIKEKNIIPPPYKDWGGSIDDDEIFTLAELDDFISTNLAYLSGVRDTVLSLQAPSFRKSPVAEFSLDTNYLHEIIPQPHIYPSAPRRNGKLIKMVPYRKANPIPISPHTLPVPTPFPYSYHAWLVPIRGMLPWEGCTPAVMLLSSIDHPIPTDPGTNDPIRWTHSSLLSFWTFLVDLKDAHNIGSIGLSFHASPHPARSSQPGTLSLPSGEGRQAMLESNLTLEQKSTAIPAYRAALSSVDYIKVYHEAPMAMHVRNALHLWSYVVQPAVGSSKREKVRLLKGARLVLVSERSKGILIS